jgi:hypothetical protein
VTDDDGAPATTTRQVTVSDAPPPPPPGNLVANPSFEVNTTGWAGFQGTVVREVQAGAPDGGAVARVARTSGVYFTIDAGDNVASTAAATYTATAWVKAATASSIGKPIRSSCASAPPPRPRSPTRARPPCRCPAPGSSSPCSAPPPPATGWGCA